MCRLRQILAGWCIDRGEASVVITIPESGHQCWAEYASVTEGQKPPRIPYHLSAGFQSRRRSPVRLSQIERPVEPISIFEIMVDLRPDLIAIDLLDAGDGEVRISRTEIGRRVPRLKICEGRWIEHAGRNTISRERISHQACCGCRQSCCGISLP